MEKLRNPITLRFTAAVEEGGRGAVVAVAGGGRGGLTTSLTAS